MKNPGQLRESQPKVSLKSKEHPRLKTDYPLSEKDEVKQAEEKMRKGVKGKE